MVESYFKKINKGNKNILLVTSHVRITLGAKVGDEVHHEGNG